jgi:hypothetical protein
MAQQIINIGTTAGDGTGEPVGRNLFDKINDNFSELYPKVDQIGGNFANSQTIVGEWNTIDSSVLYASVTGGSDTQPNRVGSTLPLVGTGASPGGAAWGADSSYTPDSPTVTVVHVIGGYDSINNAIGSSIVGSNHSMIKKTTAGHNLIAGGSYNLIVGARSSIVGSSTCAITENAEYAFVCGSTLCEVTGDHVFVCAQNATISGDDCFAFGDGLTISGNNNFAFGEGITLSSGYNYAVGNTINVSGGYAWAHGFSLTATHFGSRVFGRNGTSPATYSDSMCRIQMTEADDARSFRQEQTVRTTGTSLTNTVDGITWPSTKITVGHLHVKVVGMRESDGAMAVYEGTYAFRWNGPGNTGYFGNPSGNNSGAGPTLNLVAVIDELSLATVPNLRMNTGLLRLQVAGLDATNIKWHAQFEITQTCITP